MPMFTGVGLAYFYIGGEVVMLDIVLKAMLIIWVYIGPVALFFLLIFIPMGKTKWSDFISAGVVYLVGIALIASGYNIIEIFTNLYDGFKGTAEIVKIIQDGNKNWFMVVGYTIIKYLVKILLYALIAHTIIKFGDKSDNKFKFLGFKLSVKLLIAIGMVLMAPFAVNLNFNLEFFIRYEGYITLAIAALFVFLEVCKKFLSFFLNFGKKGGNFFTASLMTFFAFLLLDALVFRYFDKMILGV